MTGDVRCKTLEVRSQMLDDGLVAGVYGFV